MQRRWEHEVKLLGSKAPGKDIRQFCSDITYEVNRLVSMGWELVCTATIPERDVQHIVGFFKTRKHVS